MRPLTKRRPKPMIPVADRPLLEYVVEAVAEAGIDDLVLVVGYQRERIQNYFGDGSQWGVDIEYRHQQSRLGTGHAVARAREFVDDQFLVLNGDCIVDPAAIEQVLTEAARTASATMAVTRVDNPGAYGVVTSDGGHLLDIEEKPAVEPPSDVINAGVYRFDRSIFDAIARTDPDADGEISLTEAITNLATDRHVDVVPYRGTWTDVSQLWDLLSVNDTMLDTHDDVAGRVHEDATVTDRARLSESTRVGPNATVRRGTSLGPNVSVGANAVVSNAVVLRDTTIADGAVLRDCIVGENVTVGPNSTVVGGDATVVIDETVHSDVRFGGVIGDHTRVGGNVVLEPGTIVGDAVTVHDGTVLDGRVDSTATVRRG